MKKVCMQFPRTCTFRETLMLRTFQNERRNQTQKASEPSKQRNTKRADKIQNTRTYSTTTTLQLSQLKMNLQNFLEHETPRKLEGISQRPPPPTSQGRVAVPTFLNALPARPLPISKFLCVATP